MRKNVRETMKRFAAAATAAGLLLATPLFAARPAGAEEALHLTTEEYAPFNYEEGGTIVGLGAEQVREIMRRSGIAYDMELLPWSRAIGLAREKPRTCVFTTAHTVDRDAHFKWVEPLLVERTLLVRAANSAVTATTVEEASTYRTGTQTGDYTVELLRDAGFTKIDLARDLELTLKKLLSGRVDLMAVSESYLHRLQSDGVSVEEVAVLFEQVFSMACSPDTPDHTVRRMQQALSDMIADGTQSTILARYR
ncbi:transporter substrate-binding domain-containing protein [Pelagibius sp. 7325]|uniref:substrate-binding periplasmic protein n=1 Tax=Pelagibius sp. 7325 TaxID=3131994 RepID=UPI0030EF00D6